MLAQNFALMVSTADPRALPPIISVPRIDVYGCHVGKENDSSLIPCTNDGTFVFCCKNNSLCHCPTGVSTFRVNPDMGVSLAGPSPNPSSIESSATRASSARPSTTVSTGTTGILPESTTQVQTTPFSPSALPNPQPSNHNVAIRAGVGVPLGLIPLAAFVFLLIRDRRNKRLIRGLQQNSNDLTGEGNGIEEPKSNGPEQLEVQGFDEPEWKGKGSAWIGAHIRHGTLAIELVKSCLYLDMMMSLLIRSKGG